MVMSCLSILQLALLSITVFGCGEDRHAHRPNVSGETPPMAKAAQKVDGMQPITTVAEAVTRIESYKGAGKDFLLPVADSLQDPVGMNMAIITDTILAKGFWPNGFDQKEGFKVYKYKDQP